MKFFSHSKGFTLVELLVSLAILSILIVGFTTFFGWSITNIVDNGEKSKAIAKGENKLEELYAYVDINESLDGYTNGYVSLDKVLTYQNQELNFSYEEGSYIYDGKLVQGYNVTIVVFYMNGQRHVSLSSFILKEKEGGT